MTLHPAETTLLSFFKALADETRLKILGLLAGESLSQQQLAARLELRPARLGHHLARLAEAGLVGVESVGPSKRYTLRRDVIAALAENLLFRGSAPRVAEGLADSDRKVLNGFLKDDGALREIPAQEKKLLVVLGYLRDQFEPGRAYDESQVNQVLAPFHADTASLRRALIDYRLMDRTREGSKYWRIR